MAINDWPEDQRPRERLIKFGAPALSDAELLAVFLRIGVKGKSAVDLGRVEVGREVQAKLASAIRRFGRDRRALGQDAVMPRQPIRAN